jgi:hypothetical protein
MGARRSWTKARNARIGLFDNAARFADVGLVRANRCRKEGALTRT